MVKKKSQKTSMSKSNNEVIVPGENSDEESFYLPLKYPTDQKYYEFIKEFKINSQDRNAAETSTVKKGEKIQDLEKCESCALKFNKKVLYIGCSNCLKWFCLKCSLLTKKEATEITKSNVNEWRCQVCLNDNSDNDTLKLKQENDWLRKHITEINVKLEYVCKKLERIEHLEIANGQIEENLKKILEIMELKQYTRVLNEKSYSEMVKSNQNNIIEKDNLPVVVIKPKNIQYSKQTREEVKRKIDPVSIKATVKDVREIKNGGIIIKTNTREELQKLKEISEKTLKENYTVELSKMKLPRLVIIGSRKKYENDELLEELKLMGYLKETDQLNIKYTRQSKYTRKFIIYIECNGECFKKLLNQGEVSLGWDKCQVREDMNIIICYKCYGYGHKTINCTNNQICSFCAGNHIFWNCKQENPLCNNCRIYNERYKTNINCAHEAISTQCIIHKRKINEIKERTNYS